MVLFTIPGAGQSADDGWRAVQLACGAAVGRSNGAIQPVPIPSGVHHYVWLVSGMDRCFKSHWIRSADHVPWYLPDREYRRWKDA